MKKSESITEISKAMVEFQKEVKQPFKDKSNPFFKSKYVPLESVVESIHTIAPKHGLSFTQWALNNDNGTVGIATLLLHTSGEWIEFDPVFIPAEKQTPQGYGALITYLKRYTLSAIFGITSDEDDDANGSSGKSKQKTVTQKSYGELKTLSMKFAQMNKKSDRDVHQVLLENNVIGNIDITQITESEAKLAIDQVKGWIERQEKKEESK